MLPTKVIFRTELTGGLKRLGLLTVVIGKSKATAYMFSDVWLYVKKTSLEKYISL